MFPHLLYLTHDLFSDLITVTRGGTPWRRIPILGTFCRVSSLLLEVPLAQGVTFWVPTHAPQVSVTHPGSVSTFLSYHAFIPGYDPLLGRIYPKEHREVAWASRVYVLPNNIGTMVLKPSFSPLELDFWRFRPLHSLLYPWVSGVDAISVLYWRCHQRPGNASSSWRRLFLLATPLPRLILLPWAPQWVPPYL